MVARDISLVEMAIANGRGATILRAIFGATDGHAVAEELDLFCRAEAGSGIRSFLYCELSVGAAFGAELQDGRRLALKLHQASRDPAHLHAARAVQSELAESGFPCARPLGHIRPVGAALGWAEEYLSGDLADAHDPPIRREMARTLARLVGTASACGEGRNLPRGMGAARGGFWPPAPNHAIDITTPDPAAAWIDGVGEACRRILDHANGPLVVGHCDWSVKNLRFQSGQVSAVYDWDSLYLARETEFVGVAAAIFPATWYIDVERAPSLAGIRAFVDEYEEARGEPFSQAQRSDIAAACTYWIAYNARCELALDPAGTQFHDNRRLLAQLGPRGVELPGDEAAAA